MSRTSAENETDIDKVKLKLEELQKLELCAVATITSLKKKNERIVLLIFKHTVRVIKANRN